MCDRKSRTKSGLFPLRARPSPAQHAADLAILENAREAGNPDEVRAPCSPMSGKAARRYQRGPSRKVSEASRDRDRTCTSVGGSWPKVRISCWAADWLGESDLAVLGPFFEQRGEVCVLHLEVCHGPSRSQCWPGARWRTCGRSIHRRSRISGGRWTFKKGREPVLRPCPSWQHLSAQRLANCRLLRAYDLRSHRRAPKRRDELRRINWSKWIWIGRQVLQIGQNIEPETISQGLFKSTTVRRTQALRIGHLRPSRRSAADTGSAFNSGKTRDTRAERVRRRVEKVLVRRHVLHGTEGRFRNENVRYRELITRLRTDRPCAASPRLLGSAGARIANERRDLAPAGHRLGAVAAMLEGVFTLRSTRAPGRACGRADVREPA
jgi:hypothetical protein